MIASLFAARGFARLKKGDKSGAVEDFTKAIELKPDEDVYYEARLYLENGENDFQKALGDLTHLIDLKPDETDLLLATRGNLPQTPQVRRVAGGLRESSGQRTRRMSRPWLAKEKSSQKRVTAEPVRNNLQQALRLATDPKEKEKIQTRLRAIGVGPL